MQKPIIYVIDDQPSQRKMLEWDLRDLFGAEYNVVCIEVADKIEGYFQLLDSPDVVGLLVDQMLHETGLATGYTGVDLARSLRAAFPEMPIFLITGYAPDDQIKGAESGAVDAVVFKDELRAGSPEAERFKQRFLRQAKRYEESLTEWQREYRSLLTKKLNSTITDAEGERLAELETQRLIPTQAAEDATISSLDKQIQALEAAERIVTALEKNEQK